MSAVDTTLRTALEADAAHADYLRRRHFGSLDGLRCLSIVAVIWHHTGSSAASWPFLQHGYLGVSLFFVISGYLITTLLLREKQRQGDISLRSFYVRRTLRIFPMYYTVLLLYVALVWLLERDAAAGRAFFANLPYFLTYTSNWFVALDSERVIFYFVWSLAAEEQFYLLWPSVEKRLRPAAAVLLMVVVLSAVTLLMHGAAAPVLADGSLVYRILTSFPIPIGIGVLLAHALHNPNGYRLLYGVLGQRSSAPLLLLLLLAAMTPAIPAPWLIYWLMTALVASIVIREDSWLAPVLRWPPVAHIGVISYGLYLLHMLSYRLVDKVLTHFDLQLPLLPFLATLLVSVAAATLSYRYYESFFLRLKARFAASGVSRDT